MEIFEDRQKKSENPKHDRIAKCQQTPGERHRLEQHPKVSKSWDLQKALDDPEVLEGKDAELPTMHTNNQVIS